MILINTRAVLHSAIKRLVNIKIASDFICQIILLLLCAYNVYDNLNNIVRLIVYSSMLAISLFWLIYTIIYYVDDTKTKKEKKRKAKTNNIVKVIKMVYKVALITYSIVEMAMFGYTTFSLVILLVSILSFISQIVATIISNRITFYASAFEFAIEKDMVVVDKTKEVVEKITHPIYGVSSMFVDEEKVVDKNETKKEVILEKMKKDYLEEVNEKQDRKDKEKDSEKEHDRNRRQEVIDSFKNKIKEKFTRKK